MKVDIKSEKGAAIAVLGGEIDHHSAKAAREQLDSFIINMQPEVLALDMSGITFMDSSGIGLIMGRHKLMRECGGRLEVTGVQEGIRRVLRLAGIERIVKIS
ncbi:MAG: STAS domain-containing protein [Ruminococcus sp.]|nr:STAS domain-containing protein [Ruminococcus sp.]